MVHPTYVAESDRTIESKGGLTFARKHAHQLRLETAHLAPSKEAGPACPAAGARPTSRGRGSRDPTKDNGVGRVLASEKIYMRVGHDERSGIEPDIRPTCPVASTRVASY